ncbi:MAG TPA: hypothetical protein VNN12_02400, partial [Dehalococcoidia bacterium]|nr:hypothetical protein [Dehalococcoidia bacterium]
GHRLQDPTRRRISIPVYLGDSLQWNTKGFLAERDVLIEVPDGPLLEFPGAVARDPVTFDAVIQAMLEFSERDASPDDFVAWLHRERPVDGRSEAVLRETYDHLRALERERRDHVWGYVARNLSRPVWLSSSEQRADVVIGNPPWLSYRYMSRATQEVFRRECQERGIWAGGKVATHQDLSAYFFARSVELYLKDHGVIAFLMPYAALNRKQFERFRRGWFGGFEQVFATVRFTAAWAFDESVQPLFPVPSCVLFARRRETGPLPSHVRAASGQLPRRDATPEEADAALTWREEPWPKAAALEGGSAYRSAFRQGATMVPRMLCTVVPVESGRLGMDSAAPLVKSRRSPQEKPPWKTLPSIQKKVETAFLRPLYLGESIAPYRLLEPALAVVPWDEEAGRLLDATGARRAGYPHLAAWLEEAERLWEKHGRGGRSLVDRWDYHGELSAQFPTPAVRVVYSKAGTLPAAAVLTAAAGVVDHKLYWAEVTSPDEAGYLIGVLNSETARSRVVEMQAKGQWGPRDFDKLMFELPIPRFDADDPLHRDLAEAARQAEAVAAKVVLPERVHFVRARALIREALREDGVAQRIDALVEKLLG